jgi:DNA modification methylase
MLTCFQGSTNIVFQRILNFFVKEGSIVLDITYGRGLSWKDLKENYKIIKVDKRKLFDDVIKADFNDYLKKKESNSVDCIYFDPPYYFKEKISNFDINDQMLNNEKEVFWTEEEFRQALSTLQTEVPRVLKKDGIFIVKIMDGYIGKKYFPLAFELFNAMIKRMEPQGIFICPINKKDRISELIRINHIYYLVFKNLK